MDNSFDGPVDPRVQPLEETVHMPDGTYNIRMPEVLRDRGMNMHEYAQRVMGSFENIAQEQIGNELERLHTIRNSEEGLNMSAVQQAPPLPQVEAAPDNDNLKRARATAALLGLALTPDNIETLKGMASLAEMNRYIVELKTQAPTRVVISEQARQILATVVGIKTTPKYREIKSRLEEDEYSITSYQREIDSRIARISGAVRELSYLDSMPAYDMNAEVEKVVSAGFYQLYTVDTAKIVFKTDDVICSHISKDLNVKMAVNLGQFLVYYYWSNSKIEVLGCGNNVQVEGLYHPHVLQNGSVCWGNAANVVNKAKPEHKIFTILTALRQLLMAYNPDSPYRELHRYDRLRNPDKYKDGAGLVMVEGSDTVVVYGNEAPSDQFLYTHENDDDGVEDGFVYREYYQSYPGEDDRVNDDVYIKGDNGTYIRLNGSGLSWDVE